MSETLEDEFLTTPNYGLKKPFLNADDDIWGLHINDNTDAIDGLILKITTDITATYLPLAGGKMKGPLSLASDPVLALDAASKQYVDTRGPFMNQSGGTFTGPVYLWRDPQLGTEAATKNYVDLTVSNKAKVQSVAGRTGDVILSHVDITDWDAALPQGESTLLPIMDGAAAPGGSAKWARADHVHPTDTSLYPASNPLGFQTKQNVVDTLPLYSVPLTTVGQPNGVAGLNASGQVPTSQLPPSATGTLNLRGVWTPTTNAPPLASGGVGGSKTDFYVAGTSGTSVAIDGVTTWTAGDWILNNGAKWEPVRISSGFGTIATQNANAVAITGGTIAGLSLLGVADSTLQTADYRMPAEFRLARTFNAANGDLLGGISPAGYLIWNKGDFTDLTADTFTVPLLTVGTVSQRVQDYRLPVMGKTWESAAGDLLGAIDPAGALRWGTVYFDTLTATTLHLANLDLTGAFSPAALTVQGTTWQAGDYRYPDYAATIQATNGDLLAAWDKGGAFNLGVLKTVAGTLLTDAASATDIVNKGYADKSYIPVTGGKMAGALLSDGATPTDPLTMVNKSYVDAAAAAGGAGGLAGLQAQRDFPQPSLRDPKRDRGAKGDGIADDSSLVNATVADAVAAGERMIQIADTFNVPSLGVDANKVIFVGPGKLVNNVTWKWVAPAMAPDPHAPGIIDFNIRRDCPNFCALFAGGGGTGVVVLTGDSVGAPFSNGITGMPQLWTQLRAAFIGANPGLDIRFFNRAIGGGTWAFLDTQHPTASGTVSWYTDPDWLDNIEPLHPHVLMINFTANDGMGYRARDTFSVLSKTATWSPVPEIVMITSQPYAQMAAANPSNSDQLQRGAQYCGGFMRTWARTRKMGLIDSLRYITMNTLGIDTETLPLIRDPSITGGFVNSHQPISLPYTWPVKCWGYGGQFYVASPADWTSLGNEVQFELSTPAQPANRGNLLRVGRDTGTGKIYYRVDVTQIALGGDQDLTFIPKTVVTDWDASAATAFQFSVIGDRLLLQGGYEQDPYIDAYLGPVPRFPGPWQPKVTCTAGTVTNKLLWGKVADGNICALVANPNQGTMFMPRLTDLEAHGTSGSPDVPGIGGSGGGHTSSLLGPIWQQVIDACDFRVNA